MTPIRIYLSLLIVATVLSCAAEVKQQKSSEQKIGDLVYGLKSQVFNDANLSFPMSHPASVGLLVEHAAHDKVWLSDGRMGWISEAPLTASLTLAADQGMAPALSELPDQSQGAEDWVDLAINSQSTVIEVSAANYQNTPPSVARQGRTLFAGNASVNWPLFKVQSGQSTGWIAPADIQLTSKILLPLSAFSGLVQKPFLTLIDLPNIALQGPSVDSNYVEIADQYSRVQKVPRNDWQMEQAIVPDDNAHTTVNLIVLYSATNNCNIFTVFRKQSPPTHFGYCQYGSAAPTPVVDAVNYDAEGQVILDILEAAGDFTEIRKVLVP